MRVLSVYLTCSLCVFETWDADCWLFGYVQLVVQTESRGTRQSWRRQTAVPSAFSAARRGLRTGVVTPPDTTCVAPVLVCTDTTWTTSDEYCRLVQRLSSRHLGLANNSCSIFPPLVFLLYAVWEPDTSATGHFGTTDLVPKCPDTSAPSLSRITGARNWCRSVVWPKCPVTRCCSGTNRIEYSLRMLRMIKRENIFVLRSISGWNLSHKI